MKNIYFLSFFFLIFTLLHSCKSMYPENSADLRAAKIQNILYFNPEIFPDLEEIKEPTYSAFDAAVSGKINHFRNLKMLRVDSNIPFDSADKKSIKEFCHNNDALYAIVPKVKYFKVGFGKYIFSNQVIVSMKLYDASGELITEADYDTFRKNARILGSAENSIKIGTEGAINTIAKDLSKTRKLL